MHVVRRSRCNLAIEFLIKLVDLDGLKLLQRPRAQRWHDVTAQQLRIAFEGSAPHHFLSTARRAGVNPAAIVSAVPLRKSRRVMPAMSDQSGNSRTARAAWSMAVCA